jgi:Uma2 family endonuclease
MSTATMVSAEVYLGTSYRPDCDFIEGQLIDRNVGLKEHSKLLGELIYWFRERSQTLLLRPFPAQRIRVAARRYRVPDVCVVPIPEPDEQIFTQPPYICIEILSTDDTFPQLQDRLDDYLAMGVPNIWVLDPASRRAWTITHAGHFESLDGNLRTSDNHVALPIADLFQTVV